MQLSSSHDAVHLVVIIHIVCNIYSESFICNTVEMTIPWTELGCKSFTFGTEYRLTEYHCTDSLLWMYIFFLSKKTFMRVRMKVSVLQTTNMTTLATSCEELTHWKSSDAGRDWGQEEKGTTEDEMSGWHHWLDGRESEWTPGVGDGQGGLVCCDSWGHKESDTTEWLNWTELMEAPHGYSQGFSAHRNQF